MECYKQWSQDITRLVSDGLSLQGRASNQQYDGTTSQLHNKQQETDSIAMI